MRGRNGVEEIGRVKETEKVNMSEIEKNGEKIDKDKKR